VSGQSGLRKSLELWLGVDAVRKEALQAGMMGLRITDE
jgi:hypothetical protein